MILWPYGSKAHEEIPQGPQNCLFIALFAAVVELRNQPVN